MVTPFFFKLNDNQSFLNTQSGAPSPPKLADWQSSKGWCLPVTEFQGLVFAWNWVYFENRNCRGTVGVTSQNFSIFKCQTSHSGVNYTFKEGPNEFGVFVLLKN